jgi:transposase-like protein
MQPISLERHRFAPEVIRYAVWLNFRFTLSIRDVEEFSPSPASTSAARRSAAG